MPQDLYDGISFVRFLAWLETTLDSVDLLSENC